MRKNSRKDAIHEAALRLFSERGVDGVSLQDIATEVGIRKSGLFAHVASKHDLALTVVGEACAEYATLLAAAAAREGDFRSRLRAVVAEISRLHDEDPVRFRLVVTRRDEVADLLGPEADIAGPVRQGVADAMDAGEIPRRDPALVAAAVVGIVLQPAAFIADGRLDGGMARLVPEICAACERVLR